MPAFPYYKSKFNPNLPYDTYSNIFDFDVTRTPPWTGRLPFALMRRNGSFRSRFPLNTLVSYGYHTEFLFSEELQVPFETPCGPNSAWARAVSLNAKIAMFGCDLAHSLTMIHYVEDAFENDWPVKDWYRKRSFNVITPTSSSLVRVRERRPFWATFYAERYFNKKLFNSGVATDCSFSGMSVSFLSSTDLVAFLRKSSGLFPYYIPPLLT